MTQLHAAGWTSESPTPAQLKEFFSQVESGKVTKDRLQAFLRGETPMLSSQLPSILTQPEQAVASILGTNKIIGYRDAMRVWGIEIPEVAPFITYTDEAILEACAAENKKGDDWRLVYVNGFSLRQMEETRGRNRKKQPCFDPDSTWWLESAQDPWATQAITPGYRLLDFKGRFARMNWQRQNEEIAKLGPGFSRAEEQAVAEAVLSIYMVRGKTQRLLRDWYHWGNLGSASGDRVSVGSFDDQGFDVDYYWNDGSDSDLRVVLSR
jgi:hypothetical protein